VLAFFSLSGTKLPHYVLYGSTPLFLLLARHWGSGGRLPLFGAVALLGLWPALPWLTVMLAERASNGYYADQLRTGTGAGGSRVLGRHAGRCGARSGVVRLAPLVHGDAHDGAGRAAHTGAGAGRRALGGGGVARRGQTRRGCKRVLLVCPP
jgi:4-amino-4-deoxy-L-arabinose transferase-like glycosyltransferase